MRVTHALFLLLPLAGACVGDENDVSSNDSGDDGGASDATTEAAAGDGGPPCDPTAAFGAPALVASVNSSRTETGAWLSPDELTMWLERDDGDVAGAQISVYVATRSTTNENFGTPTIESDLTAPGLTFQVALTDDLLSAYLSSDRAGTTGYNDIFVASRSTSAATFGAAATVATVNSTADDYTPFILGDQRALYFASTREADGGSGDYNLYRAARATGGFSEPVPLAELNTSADEDAPVLTQDDLAIYFRRSRNGVPGPTGDVWMATRAQPTDAFSNIQMVAGVNDPSSAALPRWLSRDACRLYLTSDRAGGLGGADIYLAVRSP